MLQIKGGSGQDSPIEDEVEILTGAAALVKNTLGSIVTPDEHRLNPASTTCAEINFSRPLKLPRQDENAHYSPVQLLRITRKNAVAYGIAYANLGGVIHDLVHYLNEHGAVEVQAFGQCRDQAILRGKDSLCQGLPIEDEAEAVMDALVLVRHYLESIVVPDK